eukprot:CAMPEP_0180556826 /NCGR_PEP_ID=MMETSP1037_2-20121125/821_1 /TAXON_ID=632150 /ORGANISM="Azadinium spinosum, Strain 3D9" /LENGTH=100 /DNA_ID=CAMNT_0022572959 /DNA_START=17 /DNA_END=320 /DNA_ORIENTATION=+
MTASRAGARQCHHRACGGCRLTFGPTTASGMAGPCASPPKPRGGTNGGSLRMNSRPGFRSALLSSAFWRGAVGAVGAEAQAAAPDALRPLSRRAEVRGTS